MSSLKLAAASAFVLAAFATTAAYAADGTAPAAAARPQAALGGNKGAKGARPEDQPAVVTADQVTHDRDLNTVTATGHVEVDQGGRTLLADTLSYNLKQDVITASGNVSLTDVDGEVTFANYMELTGDMKEAASRGIRMLMIDDSRMAAATGHRVAGDRTVLDKGIYTACKPCAEHPEQAPLWQVKADTIIHDEVEHLVQYYDAWLEFAGVPILYTPYLSHADPTVKRESGLLTVGGASNQILGNGIRLPYYQVINDQQDVTISPLMTTKQGEQLGILHRWQGFDSQTKTSVSIADEPTGGVNGKATVGWHIDAKGLFDINETWRAGYQIQSASDPYYLETYGYHPDQPYLTTRPYLEGFGYKTYAAVEAYAFQNLSTAVPDLADTSPLTRKQPVVAPLVTYSYLGDPGSYGNYWSFDTHAAAVTREQGTSSRRINTLTGWHLPYNADDGEIYNLTGSLRADGYNSNNVVVGSNQMVNADRILPQMSLDWRYPFSRVGPHASETFTPIVVGSVSPRGGNPSNIPNEDSLDFELDDNNIFSAMPFSGYDRVWSGPRVAYGGEYQITNRGGSAADVLLGQSYQPHPEQVFQPGTGLDGTFSDVVGRIGVTPSQDVNFTYRYRLSKDSLDMRRSEISSSLGPPALNIVSSYVFIDKLNPASPFDQREQLSETLSSQMTRYWKTQLYTVQDLGVDAGPLQTGARLIYEDECLQVTGDGGSNHTVVRTFTAGHYLMFRVVFKTLTQIPVDVF